MEAFGVEVYLCISPIPDRRLAIQPEFRDAGLTRETRG
jgi:hypothetical protein